MRVNGKLEAVSWSKALQTVAQKFGEVKARGGKFGVIGSNHTTNEENFYLQKFAREGLGTNNIDHHRTGDVVTLLDALSGTTEPTCHNCRSIREEGGPDHRGGSGASAAAALVPDAGELPAPRGARLHRHARSEAREEQVRCRKRCACTRAGNSRRSKSCVTSWRRSPNW